MQESGPNLQILERSATGDPGGSTSPRPYLVVRWTFRLARWFALFTGQVGVDLRGAKRYDLQDFLGVSPLVVGMAPPDMRPLIACLRAASNHRFVGANECTTNTEDSR